MFSKALVVFCVFLPVEKKKQANKLTNSDGYISSLAEVITLTLMIRRARETQKEMDRGGKKTCNQPSPALTEINKLFKVIRKHQKKTLTALEKGGKPLLTAHLFRILQNTLNTHCEIGSAEQNGTNSLGAETVTEPHCRNLFYKTK